MTVKRRATLPAPGHRTSIGPDSLAVSPICIGRVQDAATIPAAFDAGVNFFLVSMDLHWPLYEATRRGLADLLSRGASVRSQVVVAVVSYLDQPLFGHFAIGEVIRAVPGLQYVDVLLAGAVATESGFMPRIERLVDARASRLRGVRAVGASFHHLGHAADAVQRALLDIAFVRSSPAYPEAVVSFWPHITGREHCVAYGFNSTRIARRASAPLSSKTATDCYRWALAQGPAAGILCSPRNPDELQGLVAALDAGPLSIEAENELLSLAKREKSRMHRPPPRE